MCEVIVLLPVSSESAMSKMQSSQPDTFVAITTDGNGLSTVMGNKGQVGQWVGTHHQDSEWF